MEEPSRPSDSDCCGSGCKPCIFDIYEEKLRKWKTGNSRDSDSKAMNEIKYSPFVIKSIENAAVTLKIFHFQAVTLKTETKDGILIQGLTPGRDFDILKEPITVSSGQYFIMKGADAGNAVISRAYTPVLEKSQLDGGSFTVIISLLENGKMSQFLNKLTIDDIVFWRGPYREFNYSKNSFKALVLFGGGTGVVPLYNIAKSVVEDEEEETRVSLVCSFKTVGHIVLRSHLNQLMDYWNFKLKIFIPNGDGTTDFRPNYRETFFFKRINDSDVAEELNVANKEDLFAVISGPEIFNKTIENHILMYGININNIFIFR